MTLLVSIYAANFVDRTIINVLQQPIKLDLVLRDWQLGLLGGTSFALFYTLLGITVARAAERHDRIHLLTVCIVAWSAFTMLCGAVTGFGQLLLLRVGVAIGESGATPAGQSLISDYYPVERRAGALAVFASGNTIGQVLGALLAALAGQALGWRWTFVLAGSPGIVLAVLCMTTLRDPRAHASAPQQPVAPLRDVARGLFAKPSFRHLAAATSLTLFATYGIASFIVPHLMRSYALSLRAAGLIGGVGGGVMLGLGTLGGAFVAQRAARRDRRWLILTPAICIAAAAPLGMMAFGTTQVMVAAIAFLAMNGCIGTFQGPLFASVHSLVAPRSRATATAILLSVVTLFGLGLGPLTIGALSDGLAGRLYAGADYAIACRAGTAVSAACVAASAQGLRLALLAGAGAYLWAALHFVLAARTSATDSLD
jgi:predicted MFS family arabinose efflux permease